MNEKKGMRTTKRKKLKAPEDWKVPEWLQVRIGQRIGDIDLTEEMINIPKDMGDLETSVLLFNRLVYALQTFQVELHNHNLELPSLAQRLDTLDHVREFVIFTARDSGELAVSPMLEQRICETKECNDDVCIPDECEKAEMKDVLYFRVPFNFKTEAYAQLYASTFDKETKNDE